MQGLSNPAAASGGSGKLRTVREEGRRRRALTRTTSAQVERMGKGLPVSSSSLDRYRALKIEGCFAGDNHAVSPVLAQ